MPQGGARVPSHLLSKSLKVRVDVTVADFPCKHVCVITDSTIMIEGERFEVGAHYIVLLG